MERSKSCEDYTVLYDHEVLGIYYMCSPDNAGGFAAVCNYPEPALACGCLLSTHCRRMAYPTQNWKLHPAVYFSESPDYVTNKLGIPD
jgi:hypothetical protein